MKQKFVDQIEKIANLPERIKTEHTVNITWITEQEAKKIKSLTDHLRQILEEPTSLDFELLWQIMGEREYDRTIRYEYPDDINLEEVKAWREGIQELKAFFDNPNYSTQQKKSIEKIIIFGLFLQATYDFYQALEEYLDTSLQEDSPNYNKPDWAIQRPFRNYHWFLDHLSYKCNPTAYKAFSVLSYTALWLLLASLIILPIAVPLMMFGSPLLLAGVAITALTGAFFICATFFSSSVILTKFGIDTGWGANWAYPIPYVVLDELAASPLTSNPTEIGILPSVFGRPKIPAGSSFKIMNRFGFFPFKEIASEAIETTENILEKATGETSVKLPSTFR